LWLLALPLVATLYQYGKFTVNDVWQTREALLGYSVGLLGLIAVKILAPGFYARQNIKTPVRIAFVTLFVSQTLALILMWRIGHAGLTLSISIGALVNAGLLFWFLRRGGHYQPQPGWLLFLCKLLVALGVLAALLYALSGSPALWLEAGPWQRIGRLAWIIAAGAAAYFATLFLLGFRFADFARREG
jgi:putative peptidoglycan lipid II flippase